MSSGRNQVANE